MTENNVDNSKCFIITPNGKDRTDRREFRWVNAECLTSSVT